MTESEKQHFVLRLKNHIQFNLKKSLKSVRPEDSNVTADFTCTLGTPQKQMKQRHRVVTSLMGITAEEIVDMYKSRWAIDSFFRWIKLNLNVPVLFGTTPNAVFNQLFAAMIAYVLLKFIHVQRGKKKTHQILVIRRFYTPVPLC